MNLNNYLLLITRGGGGPGDLREDVYPGGGCGSPRWWRGKAPSGGDT